MDKQQVFELAKKASMGDEKAFEALLEEKSRHILYNAYDILNNHHDAEDAAQEVVVKMYQYIGNLRDPENFNAWLHRIIHNVCISKLRKSKYYKNDLDVETIMDTTFSESLIEKDREFLPHAFAEDQSLSNTLLETIKQLPKRRRRAVLLYYYEDLSQKEIAEVMDISESTVASNILRAKKDIKEKLEARTGMDIDSEMRSQVSKLAAVPVLGQVLGADAAVQFGPGSVANLVNSDFKNADNSPKQGNHSTSLGVKIAALVTAAGVACGGAFIALDTPAEKAQDPPAPAQTEQPITEEPVDEPTLPAFTENGEIVFSGGDCDCGHENPSVITLDYNKNEIPGELEYRWEIVNEGGGIVTEGTGESINVPAGLTQSTYTAKFILTDEAGNIMNIERDFEIK